jgi:hypothetical protein
MGGLNLYAFVENAPTWKFDILGLSAASEVSADITAIKNRFQGTTTDAVVHYLSGTVMKLYAAYGGVSAINFSALPAGVNAMYTTGSREVALPTGYTGGSFNTAFGTLHELTHAYDDIFLGISFTPLNATEGHAAIAEKLVIAGAALVKIEETLADTSLSCQQKYYWSRLRWRSAWTAGNYTAHIKMIPTFPPGGGAPTFANVPLTASDHDTYVAGYGLQFRCPPLRNAMNSLIPDTCCFRFTCEKDDGLPYGSFNWTIGTGQNLPSNLQ